MTVTELVAIPFGEIDHTSCALYFFNIVKTIATLQIFFLLQGVSVEENIFCQEVEVVKNKNLEDVTVEQLQADARCLVQHPGFEETVEADSVCICFITKHQYTALPWFFRFLCFISCCFPFIL